MTESDSSTAPAVPGYRVLECLGGGGSGEVWRATRLRDGMDVALKVVPGDRPDGVREGTVVGVPTEHVVAVHEVLPLAHHRTAVVMDLMGGGSLRQAVAARGRLSAGECVTVIAPLASALGVLHRRGVVHGDVSPDNVLFDLRGRPHLSDLGASHTVGDVAADVQGTDGFVAPEVLVGGAPDAASDVFSLCALGWFCLTGEEPDLALVRGSLADELARAAPAAGLPPGLVEALDAGLVSHSRVRPGADELAVAVFDSAAAEPLVIAPGGDVTAGLTRRLRAAVGPGAASGVPGRHTDRGRGHRSGGRVEGARGRRVRSRRGGEGARGWPGRSLRHVLASRVLVGAALGLVFIGLVAAAAVLVLRPKDPVGAKGTSADPAVVAAPPPAADRPDPLTRRRPVTGDLVALVQSLSDLRATAWSHPEGAAWRELAVPDGPAARADEEDRQRLVAAGEHASGLEFRVRDAGWAATAPAWGSPTEPTTLVVRTRVDVAAHALVSGTARRDQPAATGPPLDLELRWDGGRWRVWEVRSAVT